MYLKMVNFEFSKSHAHFSYVHFTMYLDMSYQRFPTIVYFELTCIRLSVAKAYKQNKVLGVVVLKPSVKTDRQITVMSFKLKASLDNKYDKNW